MVVMVRDPKGYECWMCSSMRSVALLTTGWISSTNCSSSIRELGKDTLTDPSTVPLPSRIGAPRQYTPEMCSSLSTANPRSRTLSRRFFSCALSVTLLKVIGNVVGLSGGASRYCSVTPRANRRFSTIASMGSPSNIVSKMIQSSYPTSSSASPTRSNSTSPSPSIVPVPVSSRSLK